MASSGAARLSPSVGLSTTSPILHAVAGVAARLATAEELDEKIIGTLGTTRTAVDAIQAAIWLYGARGLTRAWTVGTDARHFSPEEVQTALVDRDRSHLIALRLESAGVLVGVLVVEPTRALGDEERIFITIVANLLGPELSHTAHSHQLEAEVEIQTRQIDDERRFTEKIIDSLPVGLYVIDREYRIQVWNRKRETGMQGVSREEAIGRTIFEILHRQPAETLRREFDDVFKTGRVQVFHMESRATGELRTYRISKIPMRLGDAGVTHVITIGEDVTEWREAQERFSQAEKLAAIGQLAAGVMHEINNPLATIAACAESLELRLDDMRSDGREVPKDSAEFLKIIDNEVHRCKRIVDGLLEFSRPKPATKQLTDIPAVIDQTLFLLKHHARFKKLRTETSFEPGLPQVYANREQLVQVFMALLLNAVDAMNESGIITIRTRAGRTPDEAIITEIVDQGHGIPRSETAKIFEPFYTTKAPGRGTGLGLSICYGIIQDHGGQMEVDSALGVGSTFRVVLPLGRPTTPTTAMGAL